MVKATIATSIFFLSLMLNSCLSHNKIKKDINDENIKETTSFLNFVFNNLLQQKGANILKISSVGDSKKSFKACNLCLDKEFLKDSIFSNNEKKSVYYKIYEDSARIQLPIPNLNYLEIVNDYDKYNYSATHFSKPIFLKNYTYCIFGYSVAYASKYGTSTGYTNTNYAILCVKKNGNWSLFKILSKFVEEY